MQSASRRPGPGRVGGALEDDRVAGHERRGGRAGGERDRKVEWRDHGPHAVRPHHAAVARDEDVRRVVRQLELVALVRLEVLRVDVEEVHAFLRLAERLEPVLADLEHERGRDLVDALLEDPRDLAHQRDAGRRAGVAPGRESPVRGGEGGIDFLRARVREAADRDLVVDRAAAFLGRGGGNVLAVDVHRVGLAEARCASSRAPSRSARASPPAG